MMGKALSQKSEFSRRSAKGAKYESPGQALSGAKRVALGYGPSKYTAEA